MGDINKAINKIKALSDKEKELSVEGTEQIKKRESIEKKEREEIYSRIRELDNILPLVQTLNESWIGDSKPFASGKDKDGHYRELYISIEPFEESFTFRITASAKYKTNPFLPDNEWSRKKETLFLSDLRLDELRAFDVRLPKVVEKIKKDMEKKLEHSKKEHKKNVAVLEMIKRIIIISVKLKNRLGHSRTGSLDIQ